MNTLPREMLAGSIAAGTTAVIFSPLEMVKTRLQIQSAPEWGNIYKSQSFVAVLRRLIAEDGLARVWSYGFAAFVTRDIIYSGIRIGAYPTVRGNISQFLHNTNEKQTSHSLVTKIAAGATTGAVGSAIATPIDVVRVRMSVDSGRVDPTSGKFVSGMRTGQVPRYSSSVDCLYKTWKNEGVVGGLWKATAPTAARAALLSAGQLSSYDHTKSVLIANGLMEDGPRVHTVGAIVSGVVATSVCNPADVIKSRIMATTSHSNSILAAVSQVWKQDGARGFFRGWLPAYARAGPTFFIQMPIVEFIRQQLGVEAI